MIKPTATAHTHFSVHTEICAPLKVVSAHFIPGHDIDPGSVTLVFTNTGGKQTEHTLPVQTLLLIAAWAQDQANSR